MTEYTKVMDSETSSVEELVLREATTIDKSVSQTSSIDSSTLSVTQPEEIAEPLAGESADTAANLMEVFEKPVDKDEADLSEHQFSFLLEKIKSAEYDLAKTRKVLLAAVLFFSLLTGVLLFVLR